MAANYKRIAKRVLGGGKQEKSGKNGWFNRGKGQKTNKPILRNTPVRYRGNRGK